MKEATDKWKWLDTLAVSVGLPWSVNKKIGFLSED